MTQEIQEIQALVPDLMAPAPAFSVREYAATAVGSLRDELDLAAFEAQPLAAEVLRVVAFLRALEHATMNQMRDMLITPSHRDARVTAFLTTWAYEKFWIADALGAVLARHPAVTLGAQALRHRIGGTVRAALDRFRPIGESIVANTIGTDVIAVHMARGTIDTWLAQAAYERVAELARHPELGRLFERIRGVKQRHLDFLHPQAEFRLAESAGARALARRRLARADWPAGSDAQPRSEVGFFFGQLFQGAQELLDELDARVQTLPGQGGLAVLRRRFEALA
ncbi:MAG: hypothetical protein QM635_06825 [Microbacteriaceae bacterium]